MSVLEQIEGLVSAKLAVIKTIVSLIKLEARLAGLSVYPLLLNICMLLVVLMTLWMSAMVLLGYCFLLIFNNLLLSAVFVCLLNLTLVIGLLRYLTFNLKSMSFEKTREYFSKKESPEHDKLEKTNNSSN